MIDFSADPRVAEQQMRAVIYYLTAFGFIDGDFDPAEKLFIRRYVKSLVEQRAKDALGDAADASRDVVERWTEHFYEVLDEIDDEIQAHFSESVAEGEDTMGFVLAKLKLRCFELFKRESEENRAQLLATVDALMHADGKVDPNEQQFRDELVALVSAPLELDEADLEVASQSGGSGRMIIGEPARLEAREVDHPFLQRSEESYASDPAVFAEQSREDRDLIHRFQAKLEEQRLAGAGRLAGAADFGAFAGQPGFLDGHVYVCPPPPGGEVELLVLGDLHGCYSCLKAALMQADFFAKVKAHHQEPALHPRMMLVLLGDYIDRGKFSYNGILRTVMQLFLAVPDHVFVLRGNHEYYVELNGKVLAPVRPAEAMTSLAGVAPNELFGEYMRLFEAMPNTLVFDRTLFVHAGIPREDTLAERFTGLASLNDPEIRFQMLWSDPSDADTIPLELQKASARFPFGRRQFKSFMSKLGLTTLIRGHERVVEGFRKVYDDPDATLLSLFSAGGEKNADLPASSNYREVTPMALTIRHKDGVSRLTPFVLDYERYNDPANNAFFRERLAAPAAAP
jgi:Calcineurin-like phosphoesterase